MYLNIGAIIRGPIIKVKRMGECEDFWQQSRCGYVTIPTLEQGGWQGLDRHFTPELRVTSTPHFSHTTFAEECADLVVAQFGARFHRYSVSLKYSEKLCKGY